jgi:hypothetical protein
MAVHNPSAAPVWSSPMAAPFPGELAPSLIFCCSSTLPYVQPPSPASYAGRLSPPSRELTDTAAAHQWRRQTSAVLLRCSMKCLNWSSLSLCSPRWDLLIMLCSFPLVHIPGCLIKCLLCICGGGKRIPDVGWKPSEVQVTLARHPIGGPNQKSSSISWCLVGIDYGELFFLVLVCAMHEQRTSCGYVYAYLYDWWRGNL